MDYDNIFLQYRNIRETTNTLFTIVVYDTTITDFKDLLLYKMELAKNITNQKKKTIVCSRLFNLLEYLNGLKKIDIVNKIFLVNDQIVDVTIQESWLVTLRYFNVDPIIFRYNDIFDIDYLKSLFLDIKIKNVLYVKNNLLTHYQMNSTKKRIHFQELIKSMDLEEYIDHNNIVEKSLIHGVSGALKNLKLDNHHVFTKQLSDDEILKIFEEDEIKMVHRKAKEYNDYVINQKMAHRIVFGKDLNAKIINMEIEKIFCSPKMMIKIKSSLPKQYLNFDIIEVKKLDNGDIGDIIESSYNGAFGVTYF